MNMQKLLKAILPLVIFSLLVVFLVKGLPKNPRTVPSTLIGKPMPSLPSMPSSLFKGKVTLLNVFASWCLYCRPEHVVLMDIANTAHVNIIGINYKDKPEQARSFLRQYGNPYSKVIPDPHGRIAINLGVYGTPETFIIDKKGIIRYKHAGPISHDGWKSHIAPLVKKLRGEF